MPITSNVIELPCQLYAENTGLAVFLGGIYMNKYLKNKNVWISIISYVIMVIVIFLIPRFTDMQSYSLLFSRCITVVFFTIVGIIFGIRAYVKKESKL